MEPSSAKNMESGADHKHGTGAFPKSSTAPQKLPGIRHIIAVGSGKGGVGKSTVSVNIALALQKAGARIGIVDADILGPSIPGMLGVSLGDPPEQASDGRMLPAIRHGLKVMSMGMLTGDDNPAILRGPMVGKYLTAFIVSVDWGELDYLILDLPPGTGDTQLTLAQNFPLSGAMIVTTPQDVSLKIARRGLRMFQTVNVPILGIIENMSTFTCPHCGKGTDVFRRGGGERMSQELGVPFLGSIPLDADIVTSGDEGLPIVVEKPDSVAAKAYLSIAAELNTRLEGLPTAALSEFAWNWETNDGAPAWPATCGSVMESALQPSGTDRHVAGSRTTPIGLRRRDARTLTVLWEDGREDNFDVRDLRLACPCALCVEEMSGRPLLDPKSVRADVCPREIANTGNYAIKITWNDGHSTGLYTFKKLRAYGESAGDNVVEDV